MPIKFDKILGELREEDVGSGGGAVDSVNGDTGVVVLTQDDIGDGTTYKQYSATEKTKLSGIETSADVTDTANVTSAGALMDSEVTNLAAVKSFDPTDYALALGADDNYVTDAQLAALHPAITLGTNTATALSLSGQQLSLADVFVQLGGDTMTGDLLNTAHLGVGGGLSAVNASFIMEANEIFTQTSGEKRGLSFFVGSNPSADWATTSILGLNGFAVHQANTNALGSHFGAFFGSRNAGTSTLWVSYGGFMEVQNTSTGTCDYAVGVVASIKDSGGGDFTNAYGLVTQGEVATGGTIGTFYGAYIKNPTGAGAVTTNYGLYIENQTKGTTNYALYTNAGDIRLGGNIGFYGTAPIAKQTGVAVTAAGIHAALVSLGLIAA